MNDASPARSDPRGLLGLTLLALVIGALAGFVTSIFTLALGYAERGRETFVHWAHGWPLPGFLLVVGTVTGATTLAAWLVRRFAPQAGGSGIPHVEAVVGGELPPATFRLLPVKFLGGCLAIGGGLALGREGPSVQMGATVAAMLGKAFRRTAADCRVLVAAGAGAGLATAFNAPVAGAVFVLEELVRRFDTRIAVMALGASAGAISVARLFNGNAPDFKVAPIPYPSFGVVGICLLLGAVAGLAGVAYNRGLLLALSKADRLGHWRAVLVGSLVGVVAWFAPTLVGGGDNLTQQALTSGVVVTALPLVFLLRFGLGAGSYAAATPGGLFAPMLVLGAQLGVIFGAVCHWGCPVLNLPATAFGVVGMAAFFTAVVQAPLTGIILVTEMTASFTQLLPMLIACCVAMLVPTLLNDPPIYDSLRRRTLWIAKHRRPAA